MRSVSLACSTLAMIFCWGCSSHSLRHAGSGDAGADGGASLHDRDLIDGATSGQVIAPAGGSALGVARGGSMGTTDAGSVLQDAARPAAMPPSADASSADGGLGTSSGSDAAVLALGRVRFVHVAPTAAALDICVKATSDADFTAVPLLRAHGHTSGLSYGSSTSYFDLDPLESYDFLFVEAATGNCHPPFRGFIGMRHFHVPSTSIAIYESQFTPVPGYNGMPMPDQGGAQSGQANLRFFHTAQLGPAKVDLYARGSGLPQALWFSQATFGFGTTVHNAAAGSYDFALTTSGASDTLLNVSGLNLSESQPVDAFFFSTDTTSYGLLRCPSTQLALVAPCEL